MAAKAAKKAERKAAKKQRKAELETKTYEREKATEKKMAARLVRSMASKVISGCSPIIVSFGRDMQDAEVGKVPAVVKQMAKTALN